MSLRLDLGVVEIPTEEASYVIHEVVLVDWLTGKFPAGGSKVAESVSATAATVAAVGRNG